MEILSDRNQIAEFFKSKLVPMYRNGNLIPFIGSGFSRNSQAKSKLVPSVDEVTRQMVSVILKNNPDYQQHEFQGKDLDQVAEFFFENVERSNVHNFLYDYFTNVRLNTLLKNFITLKWPFIYTLNIDDAIEKATGYEKITPYKVLNKNRKYLMNCVFKLHGDAYHEITYPESDSIIFSRAQYIRSLNENKSLLNYFTEDFFSKNIFFIGCSLENEIDLEYAIESNKLKSEGLQVERVFVADAQPDIFRKKKLEKFGITKYLIVDSFDDFYRTIVDLFSSIEFYQNSMFERFRNVQITQAAFTDNDTNKGFLLGTREVEIEGERPTIVIPSFYIERQSIQKKVLEDLKNYPVFFVIGKRLAGKTFFALSLLRKIQNEDVFYFPSNISIGENELDLLFQMENTTLIFDSNSIDADSLFRISNSIGVIKKNNLKVVVILNASNKLLLSVPNSMPDAPIKELPNRFSPIELEQLNKELDRSGLIKFKENENIIENLLRLRRQYDSSFQNKLQLIAQDLTSDDIKIVLLCSTFDKVYSSVLRYININKETVDQCCNKLNGAIEIEYLKSAIDLKMHSSYKIITNSKNMLFALLGNFLDIQKRQKNSTIISECFYDIIKAINNDENVLFSYKSLILFDNLNQIFYRRDPGVVNLIFEVYAKLQDLLYEESHYWVQRAKSILYLKDREVPMLRQAMDYIKKAYYDSAPDAYRLQSQSALTAAIIQGRIANETAFKNPADVIESVNWYYTALNQVNNEDRFTEQVIHKGQRSKSSDLYKLCSYIMMNEITNQNDRDFGKKKNRLVKLIVEGKMVDG